MSEFKIRHICGVLALALLSWAGGFAFSAPPQAPPGTRLSILHATDQAIVLELTVDGFQIEAIEHEGQAYQRLTITGMAQTTSAGEPQIPTRGALLGVPTTQGVSLQILESQYELLKGYRLLPAPALRLTADHLNGKIATGAQPAWRLDQVLYARDALYPPRPVEIGYTGRLRQQAVAQVQFYPVQYNPVTGQVRLYRRLRARVTWDPPGPVVADAGRWTSPAYEKMLRQTILNDEALKQPPVVALPPSPHAIGANLTTANQTTPALKIGLTEEGLYQLTFNDLVGAGLDLRRVDPRSIKISHRGVEIPISVPGESDGVFDPTDYILWFGRAINDIYTRQNIYWLTTGGRRGLRLGSRDGTPLGNAAVPADYRATRHAEVDSYYWQTMPDGESEDHYFWEYPLTAPETRDYSLRLNSISGSGSNATVRVRLKGRSRSDAIDPDHHTRIWLNGIEIDDQWWDGRITYDHEVVIPHSDLREGENLLRVEAVGDTAATVDQFLVNWIEIDYGRAYVAENDELHFRPREAGDFQFEISGFRRPDAQVFDVTDAANIVLITNTTAVRQGNAYTVRFQDASQPETRYLVLTPRQRRSPAWLEIDQPSSWKSPNQGADYIIITPREFYRNSLRLADQRRASGLRVATVKVEDIYDEFNTGIFNPQAIRDFLSYAYHNWTAPAPTYVLLVGDATIDYKDNLQTGTINYVPSQIVQTSVLGETPSDNWFVLLSGDDILPDMFIGRLSAQSGSEVDVIIDKIIRYEQRSPDGSWSKTLLLVADDDSLIFETLLNRLGELLPSGFATEKIYLRQYPPGDPTTDIIEAINRGSLMVQYSGHGNANRWGLWDGERRFIFNQSDLALLNNTRSWPVVAVADCVNGYFTGPKTQLCMAEAFLRLRERGAVAVWASTHFDYPTGQSILMQAFYQALFRQGRPSLGAAAAAAKIATYAQSSRWGELVEGFTLFGDPAMQLAGAIDRP